MGSYSALHLAVDFQLTVNDGEMGIYYDACKPRTLREGRKVRQQNHSEEATPELKPRDRKNLSVSFIGNHGMCRAHGKGFSINGKRSILFSVAQRWKMNTLEVSY